LLIAFLFDVLGFDVLGLEMLGLLGFDTLGLAMLGFEMLALGMLSILTVELRMCRWSGTGSPRKQRGEASQFYSVTETFCSILSARRNCLAPSS